MRKKVNTLYLREIVISVVIIAYNASETIENILQGINKILSANYPNYEIVIINNNSADDTLYRITKLYKKIKNLKIISLSKTYSIDLAYTAGLDNCIGDYCILIDPHIVEPSIIPLSMGKLFEGYDIVALPPKSGLLSQWSAGRVFITLIEKLSQNKFSYEPVHFLGFNRKVINSFTRIRRKNRNFIYISDSIGFSKTTLEDLPKGMIKFKTQTTNFFQFIIIVSDIIISNSFKPLRLLTIIGMIFSIIVLLYSFILLILAVAFNIYLLGKVPVIPFFIIGVMFFFLFSLLSLIAEYIIRILDETRNEPLYFIADEMDKSIISDKKDFNII